MHVKPIRPTPDPELGGYLPAEGRDVPRTPYWLRRLRDGDVRNADPPGPPPPPAAQALPADPEPKPKPANAGSSVSAPRSRTTRKGS